MSEQVAIVIPVYKPTVNLNERISLEQGFRILRNYPFVLVCPETMDVSYYMQTAITFGVTLMIERFDPAFFNGLAAYNGMMMSVRFYQRFSDFKYVLIYQTDAYVFRDELLLWCRLDYDYIGAPIFEGRYDARTDAKFIGIGNGGFSLRKVQSHLKVLQTVGYPYALLLSAKQFFKNPSVSTAKGIVMSFARKNNPIHRFNFYPMNEDDFWGFKVRKYCRWFKVPNMATASRFSIEALPERFIHSVNDLPFGCHAWHKYRREFWLQYIPD